MVFPVQSGITPHKWALKKAELETEWQPILIKTFFRTFPLEISAQVNLSFFFHTLSDGMTIMDSMTK